VDNDFEIKIKRLRSARRLRLRVMDNGEVVVTCPIRAPQRSIDEFVADNRDWITEHRTIAQTKQGALTAERDRLFFRGVEYNFRLTVSASKKAGVVAEGGKLLVTAKSEAHAVVRELLEKWYRQQAQIHFKKRLPLLADLVNRDVKTVTIRSQRTRWGSCSSRDTISLNWRLIMAPDFVSDYVMYHELAHLTHMNHSSRFWRLVEEYCPNYQQAEKWLKEHHSLLQF
jgi:predicted metal-dependent hydrolase